MRSLVKLPSETTNTEANCALSPEGFLRAANNVGYSLPFGIVVDDF